MGRHQVTARFSPFPVCSGQGFGARAAAVLAALWLSGCGVLGLWEDEGTAAMEPVAPQEDEIDGPRIAYETTIVGVEDDLRGVLEEASRLRELADDPPASVLALRRRASDDADRLGRVLRSRGHYAATVEAEVDAQAEPAQVTLRVDAGPVYRISEFQVEYVEPPPAEGAEVPRTIGDVELSEGRPALAEDVLAAVAEVREALRNRGYPFSRVLGHTARVNHAERTMQVTVQADSGPAAAYGAVSFRGLENVEENYLRQLLTLPRGQRFDQREVQEARRTLLDTGLFSSVNIKPAETVQEDGRLPLDVSVEETDHRSIGGGARYSSSLGLGGNLFWEHRNLFGRDEDFRAELDVSQRAQTLGADFTKPVFLGRRGQFLRSSAELTREEFDAYDRTGILAEASIERRLSPTWTASVGTGVEYARITDGDGDERSTLWGFPLRAWRDDTESRLDPRSGSRLDFGVTPYVGVYDEPVMFTRNQAEARYYYPVTDDERTVLAGRLALGTILGASRTGVPPDKRFYSGGGGSVRGYGYQLATDLDEDGNPVGGKSLFEIGLEVRHQITETIGIVPFIEGGRAFEDAVPDPADDLFWGAGIGVRYYSPVGPIRFDVAVPLRRRDVDDPFQIYISLGQAF